MAIPSQINTLIERLNQELELIAQEATEGLTLNRVALSRFPDNQLLIQFFASLNNTLFFVETTRRGIQIVIQDISHSDATDEEIQEGGEDLATRLGTVLDARMAVSRIKARLENLL